MAGEYFSAPESRSSQAPTLESPQSITEAQSLLLASLPDLGLITLVMRCLAAYGAISSLTEEQTATALLDRVAAKGLATEDGKELVALASQWFDRKRGKPVQSVNVNAKMTLEQLVLDSYKTNLIDLTPLKQ